MEEPSSAPSDARLILRTRAGDTDAYGLLYRRHVDAARRLARTLTNDSAEAEDLVSEAFAKVLVALQQGHGPDQAFRAYLHTALRNGFFDRLRRDRRLEFTDDLTPYEPGEAFEDPTISALERGYAARAFAKLPERWRMVLWHTEVEGESPAQVAPLLGLTPNGVSALAYRARERLRQMYLQEHVNDTGDPDCHWTAERLGGYVRSGLSPRDQSKVDQHLAGCAACRLLHLELAEVNAGLRGVLAPLVLGSSAAGYLAQDHGRRAVAGVFAAVGAALFSVWQTALAWLATGWHLVGQGGALLIGLGRRLVTRYGSRNVAIGGGVVVAVVVAAVAYAMTGGGPPPRHPVAAPSRPVPPAQAPATPPAAPTPPPATTTPAPAPPPAGAPATPATTPPAAGPPAPPLVVTPALSAAGLAAGSADTLALTVRSPAGAGTGASAVTEALVLPADPTPVALTVTWPAGIALRGADAGDGWQCAAVTGGARCVRASLAPGTSSTARVPVSIGAQVSGFRTVAAQITQGTRSGRASFRIPVAPPGMTVGYATTGTRARFVLAGNTLLSCLPRPLCLVGADNQGRLMVPYLPLPGDPAPPAGLRLGSAASGAHLSLPGRVVWAGLFWSGSDGAPAKVSVHAPGGGWTTVSDGGDQGYADVTGLVRAAGSGDWWVSAPADELPVGLGDWAGWSLVVLAADATAPAADLAAYVGPVRLGSLAFRLGARPTQLGVVAWDGDRCLTGDTLRVGGQAYGNFGDSHADGALESGSWNTLGVDATTYPVTGSDDSVAFSTGDDPLMVGVVVAGTIP